MRCEFGCKRQVRRCLHMCWGCLGMGCPELGIPSVCATTSRGSRPRRSAQCKRARDRTSDPQHLEETGISLLLPSWRTAPPGDSGFMSDVVAPFPGCICSRVSKRLLGLACLTMCRFGAVSFTAHTGSSAGQTYLHERWTPAVCQDSGRGPPAPRAVLHRVDCARHASWRYQKLVDFHMPLSWRQLFARLHRSWQEYSSQRANWSTSRPNWRYRATTSKPLAHF